MAKSFSIAPAVYKEIKNKPSGGIVQVSATTFNAPAGKCEIVTSGQKPIACRVQRGDGVIIITRA